MNSNNDSIVVTGMAINTPLGDELEAVLQNLYKGQSAITQWKSIDSSSIYSKVGADLGEYDTEKKLEALRGHIPEDVWKRTLKLHVTLPWSTKITTLMAIDAFVDAKLFERGFDPEKTAVIVAGHNINVNYEHNNRTEFNRKPDHIDSLYGLQVLDTDQATSVCEALGIKGPAYTVGAACASGNLALRNAVDELHVHGMESVLVVGPVLDWSPLLLHGMAMLGAISFQNFIDTPDKASRPYDTRREGFVPAHGGGALVIERHERAISDKHAPYAEVLAVEATSSASHLPTPSSDTQAAAMRQAFSKADLSPDKIDYINAHATSTPQGDLSELNAIKDVFEKHAYKLSINAPKGLLGHTCWSAPVVETVCAILQMNRGRIHRSVNIDEMDPGVDLDITAEANKDISINYMMKNSFGFGGLNCVSLFRNMRNGESI